MCIIRLFQQMYYICMTATPIKIEYNAVTTEYAILWSNLC